MIQPVKEKIILGIDPGTTIMGYGVLRVQGTKPEMIAMGIIDLRKMGDHYLKLRHIHERVLSIIESYLPDELAIEAPFFGKNVQSMLKLGRAQGVAMAAYIYGCHGRSCCRLLSFPANGTPYSRERISWLEGFHSQESRQSKAIISRI